MSVRTARTAPWPALLLVVVWGCATTPRHPTVPIQHPPAPIGLTPALGVSGTIVVDAGHGGKDPGTQHNGLLSQRGVTLVPLRMYLKHGMAKVELAVGRGRKRFEKRDVIRERELDRELQRTFKDFRRRGDRKSE